MAQARVKIAPSILAADFARLGEQVRAAEAAGVEYLHVDVMDGHFVPNITFGPPVVKSIKAVTKVPLDVHLMVTDPDDFIPAFIDAGADLLTVHVEASRHLHRTLASIRERGVKAGVVLNPTTSLAAVEWALSEVDMVLIMTVNPGFGGQKFIGSVVPKVAQLRKMLDERGLKGVEIEVDGGVNEATAAQVVRAGADVLVAGSAVFNDRESVAASVARLRKVIAAAQMV